MVIFDQFNRTDVRLRVLAISMFYGLGVLLVGLWYVQVVTSRQFKADQEAQSFRTVRIPAARGKIVDRNGVVLAENRPSYNLCLYLEELRERFKQRWQDTRPHQFETREERYAFEAQLRYEVASNIVWQVSQEVGEPVPLDYRDFQRHYNSRLSLPYPILDNLNPQQVARFQEQPNNLPGVELEIQPARFYPFHATASHILGFLVRDDRSVEGEEAFFNFRLPDYRGLVGIEGAFDQELRGKAGVKSVLVNSLGYRQNETIWDDAEPGKNLVLTVDIQIQRAAEMALQSNHPLIRGAVVVMDPNNGDVLAMASSPDFDPNKFIPRISVADYQILNDPILRPQINRAIQGNYMPGSIFKIVVGLACLEAGLSPTKIFDSPGFYQLGRTRIHDTADGGRPSSFDFRSAFIKSSNFYFVTNGLQVGIENIVRLGQHLHLGERCGIPTLQEVSGTFPSLKTIEHGWRVGDTANVSIGQGPVDVTPMQMAVMVSAVANGGTVYWPRLVSRLVPQEPHGPEDVVVHPPGQVRDRLPVEPENIEIVKQAMRGDVADPHGTGTEAAVAGLDVCGKTGTAQVADYQNHTIDHITWFASFAPMRAPRWVVVVMVQSGASGGSTCAPIARRIYRTLQGLQQDPDRLAQAF